MTERLTLARHLAAQGFCVIPLLVGGKRPARRWKRFQTERPTDAELGEWFAEHDYEPAIVTGEISGITVVDCDSIEAAAVCEARGICSGLTQRTKRGVHLAFRHAGERNTTGLDGMAGVDRRGEGGYVRAYADSMACTRADVEAAPRAPGGLFDPGERDHAIEHLALDEAPVWNDGRGGWRLDWSDLDGEHSVWLDRVALETVP